MSARSVVKELLNPANRRGAVRRQILKYVVENPGSSQLEVAAAVYGEDRARSCYKTLRIHLEKLEKAGLLRRRGTQVRRVVPTRIGKRVYRSGRLGVPPRAAAEFMRVLNGAFLTKRLPQEEAARFVTYLSPRAIETLVTISGLVPLRLPEDIRGRYLELKPQVDVWRCLKGLWLYEEQLNDPAFRVPRLRPVGPVRPDLEPIALELVRQAKLGKSIKALLKLINRLLPTSPVLGELREMVRRAYLEFRAAHGA